MKRRKPPKRFTVFEHKALYLGAKNEEGQVFDVSDLEVIEEFHGEEGVPYFSLGNKCVLFCEYVGVMQVNYLTIEVLPKADHEENKGVWRGKLIDMLRKVHQLEISATNNSSLSIKYNSILEYYIQMFLDEVSCLLHKGLLKRYRTTEGNRPCLKGQLLFSKHIAKNCVHKERFYVNHSLYDRENVYNKVLYKTLKLIQKISKSSTISSKAGALLLDFPEMPDIIVSEAVFDKLIYNRKVESYRTAINISKLLLLNYHPDLKRGGRDVLAIMFNMNDLWEKFVYVSLKKHLKGYDVSEQVRKPYWRLTGARTVKLKPDIKIRKGDNNYILDTKWKVLSKPRPAYSDLQQMYAYTKYFTSLHTILIYPGVTSELRKGYFFHEVEKDKSYPCSIGVIGLNSKRTVAQWQLDISSNLRSYLEQ